MAGDGVKPQQLAGLVPALLLVGCSGGDAVPPVAEGGEAIACAVAGAKTLAPVCAVDRMRQDGALMLVVRHPDGAFRRFAVLTDGRGWPWPTGPMKPASACRARRLMSRWPMIAIAFP